MTLLAAQRTSPLGPLPVAVDAHFREAVAAFADLLGAPVRWMDPSAFFNDGDPDLDWFTVTSAEHVTALGRSWVREHLAQFHVATQEFLSAGLDVSVEQYLDARRRRYQYVREIDELLGDHGLLLTPTVASEGWLADGRLDVDASVHGLAPEIYSTAMQNVTGVPAISVPFGSFDSGLPFGLQITAPRFHDYRLVDFAAVVEAAHPWPRTAPGYQSLAQLLDVDWATKETN